MYLEGTYTNLNRLCKSGGVRFALLHTHMAGLQIMTLVPEMYVASLSVLLVSSSAFLSKETFIDILQKMDYHELQAKTP